MRQHVSLLSNRGFCSVLLTSASGNKCDSSLTSTTSVRKYFEGDSRGLSTDVDTGYEEPVLSLLRNLHIQTIALIAQGNMELTACLSNRIILDVNRIYSEE